MYDDNVDVNVDYDESNIKVNVCQIFTNLHHSKENIL